MTDIKNKPEIFITGGTGYIGGTFLHLMIERNYLKDFKISALVRRSEDAKTMRDLGIEPVIGSLDNFELLRSKAAEASIVFNTANCDHQGSVMAIIKGLTERYHHTNERPILIHTSGAGVLSETSNGLGGSLLEDPTAVIWDDKDFESHINIPSYAPHRHVDAEVFAAAKAGFIKTYLMVPPTVFGKGLGIFAENRMSIQIPRLVYQSLVNHKTMFVGKGENQWSNIHVADLGDLYLLVLDAALKDNATEGLKGLYYPANENFIWSSVAHRIAENLFERKLAKAPTSTTGLLPGWFWGSNVRMKCSNGQSLGWQPKHGGTKEMLEGIDWDTELMLKYLSDRKH